jgi:hypothetical protein
LDDAGGAGVLEGLVRRLAPEDADGGHGEGRGGAHVLGAVADHDGVFGIDVEGFAGDAEGEGGGFAFGVGVAAADVAEEVARAEAVEDAVAEGLGLVGDDREGNGERLEEGAEVGEEVRRVEGVGVVVVAEAGDGQVDGTATPQAALDQVLDAVADEEADFVERRGLEVEVLEGKAHSRGDVFGGVDEGSVEVEEDAPERRQRGI